MPPVAFRTRLHVVAVVTCALAFYMWTLSPSVGWADALRLQLDAALGGSTYWFLEDVDRTLGDGWPFQFLGVGAWDHPLYVILAQLFVALPVANLAWRVNLLSAVTAAVAVAALFLVGVKMTGDRRAASLAAAALAVSHTFWFQAVTAEVYALHALFMLVLIGFVMYGPDDASLRVRFAIAVIVGLATANHVLFLLAAATALACSPRRSSCRPGGRELAVLAGGFLLGLAPWWIQFLRMWRVTGLLSTVQTVTGLPVLADRLWIDSLVTGLMNFVGYVGWLIYQFTPFGVAVGIWGFVDLRRRSPAAFRLLLALFAVHVTFSANYQVADRYTFHVFSYVVFALAMAAGFSRLLAAMDTTAIGGRELRVAAVAATAAAVVSPIAIYAVVPRTLRAAGFDEAAVGIPSVGTGGRDRIGYFLNPNHRGDDSAERFGRNTLAALARDALVLAPKESDQETYLVLRYFQLVEQRRSDVELDLILWAPSRSVPAAILDRVRIAAPCRPLYFASLNPRSYPLDAVGKTFTATPEGGLYRIRATEDIPPPQHCGAVLSARRPMSVHTLVQEAMRKR
jgi:Protein O-mannosyl-transferase TMEM260-like